MASGFVSESKVNEERAVRQAEWEKVRKPEDPVAAPEVEICNKSLYEQLRDVREMKQAEIDESKKFKNMIRGVDEDESEFLAKVDEQKIEERRRRKMEEQEMLASMQNTVIPAVEPSLKLLAKPLPSKKTKSKQAMLLTSAIKRKSDAEESQGPSKKVKGIEEKNAEDSCSAERTSSPCGRSKITVVPEQIGARKVIGYIPSLVGYGEESSSDDDSST